MKDRFRIVGLSLGVVAVAIAALGTTGCSGGGEDSQTTAKRMGIIKQFTDAYAETKGDASRLSPSEKERLLGLAGSQKIFDATWSRLTPETPAAGAHPAGSLPVGAKVPGK